jgi:peptidoglycan/LPS O-acetylase OafA/YrhL
VSSAGEIDPGKSWRGSHGIPVVPVFDGYRAAAIIGVVLFHVFQASGVFVALGDSTLATFAWGLLPHSLDVLFIVSGFVIYLPTVARGGDFGQVSAFAIRRAARLFPAYWLVLVLALVLLAAFGATGSFPDPGEIVAHFTVVQTPALLFDDGFSLGFGVVPPVWTLSVEVGFYIVLPLVAVAYFRRPLLGLALAAAIVAVWHLLGTNAESVASFFGVDLSAAAQARLDSYYASQFPAWVLALAAGMTGAWAYVKLRDRFAPLLLQRRALAVTAAATAAFAVIVYLAGHEAVSDPNPLAGLFARQSLGLALAYPTVLAVVLVGIALTPRWLQVPFANAPMRWTGDISYAIYLIHFAVIWFALEQLSLSQDGSVAAALAWCALVFPISFIYAYLSAVFVERPVRRWAHRFGRRAQPGDSGEQSPVTEPSPSATSLR